MTYVREKALGEQTLFTDEEQAGIIALVHNETERHRFSDADLGPRVRGMIGHSHGEPVGGEGAQRDELGQRHPAPEFQDEHHDD